MTPAEIALVTSILVNLSQVVITVYRERIHRQAQLAQVYQLRRSPKTDPRVHQRREGRGKARVGHEPRRSGLPSDGYAAFLQAGPGRLSRPSLPTKSHPRLLSAMFNPESISREAPEVEGAFL